MSDGIKKSFDLRDYKGGVGVLISIGKWAGFFVGWGRSKRISLGWIAFTFFPFDGDALIIALGQTLDNNPPAPPPCPDCGRPMTRREPWVCKDCEEWE